MPERGETYQTVWAREGRNASAIWISGLAMTLSSIFGPEVFSPSVSEDLLDLELGSGRES